MRVLGLETSCDETGLAIFDSDQRHQPNQGLVGQVLYSQIALHATYGGVCLLYTSPSPRDVEESRMPSSA